MCGHTYLFSDSRHVDKTKKIANEKIRVEGINYENANQIEDLGVGNKNKLYTRRNNGRSDLARNSAVRPDAMKAKGNRRNADLTEWHLNNPSKQSMDFLMLPEEEQCSHGCPAGLIWFRLFHVVFCW